MINQNPLPEGKRKSECDLETRRELTAETSSYSIIVYVHAHDPCPVPTGIDRDRAAL